MADCSTTPLELIIATTDPELYDTDSNSWKWSGQMYWAVECLPHLQITVSDRVVPGIAPDKYLPLDKSPATWNYCNSSNCGATSDSMQLIFTFNPTSTDPNDFLQYVVDIHCHVTDSPGHAIKDSAGNAVYFDIVDVAKMTKVAYVEVWLAKGEQSRPLTINALEWETGQSPMTKSDNGSSKWWLWLLVALGGLALVLVIVGLFIYFWSRRSRLPSIKPTTAGGSANIL